MSEGSGSIATTHLTRHNFSVLHPLILMDERPVSRVCLDSLYPGKTGSLDRWLDNRQW